MSAATSTAPRMTYLDRVAHNRAINEAWQRATRLDREADRLGTAEAVHTSFLAWGEFNKLANRRL